jgi:hypothetical protein
MPRAKVEEVALLMSSTWSWGSDLSFNFKKNLTIQWYQKCHRIDLFYGRNPSRSAKFGQPFISEFFYIFNSKVFFKMYYYFLFLSWHFFFMDFEESMAIFGGICARKSFWLKWQWIFIILITIIEVKLDFYFIWVSISPIIKMLKLINLWVSENYCI